MSGGAGGPSPICSLDTATWTIHPPGEGPKMSHLCCGPTVEENVSQISCLCISSLDNDVLTELYTDWHITSRQLARVELVMLSCSYNLGIGSTPALPGETSTDTTLAGEMLWRVTRCHAVSRPRHDTVRHNKPLPGTMPHIYISTYLGTQISRYCLCCQYWRWWVIAEHSPPAPSSHDQHALDRCGTLHYGHSRKNHVYQRGEEPYSICHKHDYTLHMNWQFLNLIQVYQYIIIVRQLLATGLHIFWKRWYTSGVYYTMCRGLDTCP